MVTARGGHARGCEPDPQPCGRTVAATPCMCAAPHRDRGYHPGSGGSALLRPHLYAGPAATGQVPVLELHPLDRAFVAREIDHAGPGLLLEEGVDLGMEGLAAAELDG